MSINLFRYCGECNVILLLFRSSSYIPLGSILTDIKGVIFGLVVLSLVSIDMRGFISSTNLLLSSGFSTCDKLLQVAGQS